MAQISLWAGCPPYHPTNIVKAQSEGNTKHRPRPRAWPHPFFIHHRTLEASGTSTCTPAVQCEYHLILRSDCCNTVVWPDAFPHANHSTDLTHKHKPTLEHLECQQKNYPAW